MVASNSKKITGDQLQSLGTLTVDPSNVPVPFSATAYGGATPSAPYNAAPVPRPAPCTIRPDAGQAFGQMVVLPEFGPIPYERPYGAGQGGSFALGYQDEVAKTAPVELAFDAVMGRNDGLTQNSIRASYKRQQAKAIAR